VAVVTVEGGVVDVGVAVVGAAVARVAPVASSVLLDAQPAAMSTTATRSGRVATPTVYFSPFRTTAGHATSPSWEMGPRRDQSPAGAVSFLRLATVTFSASAARSFSLILFRMAWPARRNGSRFSITCFWLARIGFR
jgi:hypothetical protein